MKPEPRSTRRRTETPATVRSSEVTTVTVTPENILDGDHWKNKVNLAGHCAICLSENCRDSSTLNSRNNEPGLTTIWNCLPFPKAVPGNLKGRQSFPPPWTRNLVFLGEGTEGNNESKSPQLCVQCLEHVNFLVNLKQELAEITRKIEVQEKRLGEIMKFSKERRLSELLRSLEGKADLPEMCLENTIKFIETLHGVGRRVALQPPQTQQTLKTSGHTLIVTEGTPQNTDVVQSKVSDVDNDNNDDGDMDMEIGSDAEPESVADDLSDDDDDEDIVEEKCPPQEPKKPIELIDIDDDDDDDCVLVPGATGNSPSSEDERSDSEFEGQLMEVVLEDGPSTSSSVTSSKKTVAVIVKSATKITPPVIPEDLNRRPNRYSLCGRLCRICREKVATPLQYEHMRRHVGDYVTKCVNPKCFHIFVSQADLHMNHLVRTVQFPECAEIAGGWDKIKSYMCPVDNCDFKHNNPITYRKHLKRHETLDKNFTCPMEKCGETFTIRKNVEYHLMEAHAPVRKSLSKPEPDAVDCQKCDQCLKQIPFSEIVDHLWTTHQVLAEDQISCESCPRKFSQRLKFIEHVASSHKVQGFTCDICKNDIRFFMGAKLREHYFSNHGVDTRMKCDHDQCQFTTFRKDSLREHKTVDHAAPGQMPKQRKPATKTHKCDHCEKLFTNNSGLTSHLIINHGAPPLKCRFCEKTFNTERLLYRHEKGDHLGVTFSKFRCSYENCEKSFNRHRALTGHVKADHLKVRVKCDFCDQTFRADSGVHRHKKLQHPEEFAKIMGYVPDVYVCEECGRSFKIKRLLETHKLIHTGERPFTCELCGSRFRHSGSLHTHRKSHQKQGSNFKMHRTFDRDLNRRKIPDSTRT